MPPLFSLIFAVIRFSPCFSPCRYFHDAAAVTMPRQHSDAIRTYYRPEYTLHAYSAGPAMLSAAADADYASARYLMPLPALTCHAPLLMLLCCAPRHACRYALMLLIRRCHTLASAARWLLPCRHSYRLCFSPASPYRAVLSAVTAICCYADADGCRHADAMMANDKQVRHAAIFALILLPLITLYFALILPLRFDAAAARRRCRCFRVDVH